VGKGEEKARDIAKKRERERGSLRVRMRVCECVCEREPRQKKHHITISAHKPHTPKSLPTHLWTTPFTELPFRKKNRQRQQGTDQKSAVAKLFDKMHVSMDVEIRQRLQDEPLIRFIILLSRSLYLFLPLLHTHTPPPPPPPPPLYLSLALSV